MIPIAVSALALLFLVVKERHDTGRLSVGAALLAASNLALRIVTRLRSPPADAQRQGLAKEHYR